jgi:NADPH:quinone reductase-like Zn-dependent oxidoreductase
MLDVLGGSARLLTIADAAGGQQLGVPFHAGGGGELTIPALREVLALIEAGRSSIPIAGVYELDRVADALRESEHGHPAGKLVVVP